jgi:alanyl-tRNA synthetase
MRRFRVLKQASDLLSAPQEEVTVKIQDLMADLGEARKQIAGLKQMQAQNAMIRHLDLAAEVKGVRVLTATLDDVDAETLRAMTDRFRQRYPSGVAVLASVSPDGHPALVASVSEDLVKRGLHAGELVKHVAAPLGGSGGGRPTMAQAGGKDTANLEQALASVAGWVEAHLVG